MTSVCPMVYFLCRTIGTGTTGSTTGTVPQNVGVVFCIFIVLQCFCQLPTPLKNETMMNKYHQSLLLATKFRTNNRKLPFHFGICTRHLSEISTKSAYNEQNEKSSACPVTGRSRNPALTKVPSLPLLGTLFHLYSGTPKISAFDKYNYHAELRKRFGDFYSKM